jgi:phage tail sheath protein FI
VRGLIAAMSTTDPTDSQAVAQLNNNLVAALPVLKTIEQQVIAHNNVLPPSAAMAGVYTAVDNASGVWNAPANVTLISVDGPTLKLNGREQEDLNLPVSGKAVDALRAFPGRGTVVWGARTLDGNSPDFRYVQVRRTLIFVEQSIKAALEPFVFAPNTGQTWATVTSMVSGFLTGVWSRGGLMGAKASDAFTVTCGLGSTMTGQDVLDGYMIVQVTLSLIRPAEFIELTFKQTMQGVG